MALKGICCLGYCRWWDWMLCCIVEQI